ncbi:hypothetical protein, partial [Enterobacter intestinihominis]
GLNNSPIPLNQRKKPHLPARQTLSSSVDPKSPQLDRIKEEIFKNKQATARSVLSVATSLLYKYDTPDQYKTY